MTLVCDSSKEIKNYVERLVCARFLQGFEFPAIFSVWKRWKKARESLNPCKVVLLFSLDLLMRVILKTKKTQMFDKEIHTEIM